MSDSVRFSTLPLFQSSPLAPDLVLRVGFAGKRQLDQSQTENVRNRLRTVICWRLVEISPFDDAENERSVPSIAREAIGIYKELPEDQTFPEQVKESEDLLKRLTR